MERDVANVVDESRLGDSDGMKVQIYLVTRGMSINLETVLTDLIFCVCKSYKPNFSSLIHLLHKPRKH